MSIGIVCFSLFIFFFIAQYCIVFILFVAEEIDTKKELNLMLIPFYFYVYIILGLINELKTTYINLK